MSMQKQYLEQLTGVFGYPAAENPTVVIQQAAFKELHLQWRYLTIEVKPGDLKEAMQAVRALNMRGINLTIPHKLAVLEHLDTISDSASIIGAVNTVVNKQGVLHGENTDGKGFLRALREDGGVDPEGKSVLLLGAGGAARAIAVELALAGAEQITIMNRTAERGKELVSHIQKNTSSSAKFLPWKSGAAVPEETDILVNATSIGLAPDISAKPDINYDSLCSGQTVCDIIPAASTPFLEEAESRGLTALDGLGMLVYQGAIGFTLWTGLEAPVDVMLRALTAEFSKKGAKKGE